MLYDVICLRNLHTLRQFSHCLIFMEDIGIYIFEFLIKIMELRNNLNFEKYICANKHKQACMNTLYKMYKTFGNKSSRSLVG